jgi:hypothetical protein
MISRVVGTFTVNAGNTLNARDITFTGVSTLNGVVNARSVTTSANMTLANTMTMTGNYTRSAGTFTGTGGTMAFTGGSNATFNPGPNFSITAVSVNKPGATLDMQGSISVSAAGAAAFTVTGATTTVQLNANTVNVTTNGAVSNAGTISVTSNQGGIVFSGANATITGLNYSNIFVQVGAGNFVSAVGNTSFFW